MGMKNNKQILFIVAIVFLSSFFVFNADAALLGNTLGYPLQTFDYGGSIKYNATLDQFSVTCSPVALRMSSTSFPRFINSPGPNDPETVSIHITVDSSGNLVGGVAGDDLIVVGAVDIDGDGTVDYSGVLLTGEIAEFGYNDSGGTTDQYDFRFTLTGGLFAQFFAGKDIGVEITSENSTFTGDFTVDFAGGGKGNIGPITGTASIGDFVWEDLNANGIQDIGEPGIEGVSITLSWAGPDSVAGTSDDIALMTTTTGVNGEYLFSNLGSGDYYLNFATPPSYISSPQDQGFDDSIDSDPDTATGRTITTTLTLGESDLSWDAGYYQNGSIGDYVWNDVNQNGIQDIGESGIENVAVSLYDCGPDMVSGTADDTLLSSTTTDINGYYIFSDLPPGNYYVQFTAPSGYVFTSANQGTDDSIDSDADNTTGNSDCIVLSSGENNDTIDAGLFIPPSAEIGDYVWNDINQNGIQDSGEPPVGGTVVELYGCGPDQIAGTTDDVYITSTLTGSDGFYVFSGLAAGDYCVKFIPPLGYDFTVQDQGIDDAIDSDADPLTGIAACIALSAGESNRTIDAGLVQPCTIEVVKTCSVLQPPPTGNDCNGKVTSMVLQYTGEGCSASNNSQDPAKVKCIGDSALTDPVNIVATNKKDTATFANIQSLPLNGTILIDAAAGGQSQLDSETHIKIYDSYDNSLIEDIVIHTSCSQPLNVGDQFGSLKVVELTTTNGGTVSLPTSPPAATNNCEIIMSQTGSCQGKVNVLSLRYLGGDCNQTNNWQSGKAMCQDNAIISDPVRIVAKSKDGSKVLLDTGSPANVNVGDVVDIVAANAGFSQLESETNVEIYDSTGILAQTLKIHTSCSQPLNIGDRFGSLEVFAMDTTQGGHTALGTEVAFNYEITNTGTSPVVNVSVVDDLFGEIPGSPIAVIEPGETVILTTYAMISETTQNTVTVTANPGTSQCVAQATSTVTVQEPPPAPKECTSKIKAMLLKYTGPEILGATVKIFADNAKSEPVIYNNVDLIPDVTILSSPEQNNWTIDASAVKFTKKKKKKKNELGAKVIIYINDSKEVIHTSCSTPFVAGEPAPLDNPKGAPSPNWFVVDFIQKNNAIKEHEDHKEKHHKKKKHHHDD